VMTTTTAYNYGSAPSTQYDYKPPPPYNPIT
jgi:hypothetical protein